MFALMNALKAGQELKDPAMWKNRLMTLNAVTILLSAAIAGLRLAGIDIVLSDEALSLLAQVIATTLAFVNVLLTAATSKKVGL